MAEPKEYRNQRGKFYEMWVYVGVDEITGKQSTKHRRGFKTKKAARKWAADIQDKIERGEAVNDKKVLFEAFCRAWLVNYKTRVREASYRAAVSLLEHHVIPVIGKQQLKRITPYVLQSLVNGLAKQYSKSLYVRCYELTVQILRNARDQGIIPRDPSQGVQLPSVKAKAGDEPENFWTPVELMTFLNSPQLAKEFRWSVILNVLAFSGMRAGELVALTWDDVDFNAGTIRVNKTASRGVDRSYIVAAPKTEAGRRTIPMDDATMNLLKRWHVSQAQGMAANGLSVIKPKQLIFPTKKGTMTHPTVINLGFQRLEKACGISHVITAHGLRHTMNSAMSAGQEDVVTRMAVLGQADQNTNEHTYTHTTSDQVRQAVNKAADYLRKVN